MLNQDAFHLETSDQDKSRKNRKMKKLLILFLLILQSLSNAASDNKNRYSSFGFNLDLGENQYREFALNGVWGIDTIWQTGVGGSTSNNQDASRYQIGTIFVSGRWNEFFENKLTLFRSKEKPEELVGNGADIKTTAKGAVFKEELVTSFSLTLGNTSFQQETNHTSITGPTIAIRDFVQRYVVFNIGQDVFAWLLVGIEITKYSYQDAAETSFNRNKRKYSASTSIDGSSDYPDKKTKLYLSALYQLFLFDFSLVKTYSRLPSNDSVFRSIDVSYEFSKQLYPSLGISSTKYDDHSTNETLSLGLDFVF